MKTNINPIIRNLVFTLLILTSINSQSSAQYLNSELSQAKYVPKIFHDPGTVGNVFFDPDTGDVLICDNDNVSYNSAPSGIYGTPRFMAPEIVNGKAKPSTNTDLFSLAVLLFYMFMLNHPLEGKLEAEIKCMDYLAMNRLYGEHPVFIFDPKD